MTIDAQIEEAVLKGKCVSGCWADCFVNKSKGGDDIGCCLDKLYVLNNWIVILEKYYQDIYVTELDESIITEEQVLTLVGKVNTMIK